MVGASLAPTDAWKPLRTKFDRSTRRGAISRNEGLTVSGGGGGSSCGGASGGDRREVDSRAGARAERPVHLVHGPRTPECPLRAHVQSRPGGIEDHAAELRPGVIGPRRGQEARDLTVGREDPDVEPIAAVVVLADEQVARARDRDVVDALERSDTVVHGRRS